MYKLRIAGLPEYDGQLTTKNFNEIEHLKDVLLQRIEPKVKKEKGVFKSSIIAEMIDGESLILTCKDTGERHSYVDASRHWAQYLTEYGCDPKRFNCEWASEWEKGKAALDEIAVAAKRKAAQVELGDAHKQITLHQDLDPNAEGFESVWRAYRVSLRAYLALSDKDILINEVPSLV